MYNKIVLGIIALSLSILAMNNLDIIGSANAVVDVEADYFSSESMLGEVRIFAGDYAPEGWAFCDGTELKIKENKRLYNIIGDAYGGNSEEKTFMLPDLRARVAVGVGENDKIGETVLGKGKIYKSDAIRHPKKLPQVSKKPMNLTKKEQTQMGTFQAAYKPTRTADLALNYIICVRGRIAD